MSFERSCRRYERGQATMEFALTLPIFLGVFLMIFQTAVIMNVKMGITAAAREGARWASVTTKDKRDALVASKVQEYVTQALGTDYAASIHHNIAYSAGMKPGDPVKVTVSYPLTLFFPLPAALFGSGGSGNIFAPKIDVSASAIMRLEDVGDGA